MQIGSTALPRLAKEVAYGFQDFMQPRARLVNAAATDWHEQQRFTPRMQESNYPSPMPRQHHKIYQEQQQLRQRTAHTAQQDNGSERQYGADHSWHTQTAWQPWSTPDEPLPSHPQHEYLQRASMNHTPPTPNERHMSPLEESQLPHCASDQQQKIGEDMDWPLPGWRAILDSPSAAGDCRASGRRAPAPLLRNGTAAVSPLRPRPLWSPARPSEAVMGRDIDSVAHQNAPVAWHSSRQQRRPLLGSKGHPEHSTRLCAAWPGDPRADESWCMHTSSRPTEDRVGSDLAPWDHDEPYTASQQNVLLSPDRRPFSRNGPSYAALKGGHVSFRSCASVKKLPSGQAIHCWGKKQRVSNRCFDGQIELATLLPIITFERTQICLPRKLVDLLADSLFAAIQRATLAAAIPG